MALLKEGAETDKKDADGYLALDLAPDKEVSIVDTRELSHADSDHARSDDTLSAMQKQRVYSCNISRAWPALIWRTCTSRFTRGEKQR